MRPVSPSVSHSVSRFRSPLLLALFSATLLVACNNAKTPETKTEAPTQSAPAVESSSAPTEQSSPAVVENTASEVLASEPAADQSSAMPNEQSAPAAPVVHLELTPVSSWVDYDLNEKGIPLIIKAPKNLTMDGQREEGSARVVIGNVDEAAGTMFMLTLDSYPSEIHAQTMKQFEGFRQDLTSKGAAALGEQAQMMNVKIVQNKKDGVIAYGTKDGKAIVVIVAPFQKGGIQGGGTATVIGDTKVVTEKLARSIFDAMKNARVTTKK